MCTSPTALSGSGLAWHAVNAWLQVAHDGGLHLRCPKGYATSQREGLRGKQWDHLCCCHRGDKEERPKGAQGIN